MTLKFDLDVIDGGAGQCRSMLNANKANIPSFLSLSAFVKQSFRDILAVAQWRDILAVASPREGGNCPPPPTSDRASREIDSDPRSFSCRKNGGYRFTGLGLQLFIDLGFRYRFTAFHVGKLGVIG